MLNPVALQLLSINGQADLQSTFNRTLFSVEQKTPDVMKCLNAESYESKPANRYQPVNPESNQLSRAHSPAAQFDINRHDDHVQAFCFTFEDPIDPALFDNWLNLLDDQRPDILRIKGLLNMKNRTASYSRRAAYFPSAGGITQWPSEDHRTRIVFITRDVPYSVIKDTFIALVDPAQASNVS